MGDKSVNVKPSKDGKILEFTSSFSGGSLTLSYNTTINAENGVLIRGVETMIDKNHGKLFNRTMSFTKDQVMLGYEFGNSVRGANSLILIGERTRLNTFIYGQVDGNEILPMRISTTQPNCNCNDNDVHKNLFAAIMEDGILAPVSIKFPDDYAANLKKLIPIVEKAIKLERYSSDNIHLRASSGCFWATLACELAAKACILSCPATGPLVVACIVACLAAEVACLAAVNESKG